MRINKFKKLGRNKYKVMFDNEELVLYEDIILKHNLLTKKDINIDELEEIVNDNRDYDAYNLALNYIEIRLRSRKEIYEYLKKKEFNENLINDVISKLDDLGLLNNKQYIEAFINDKINLSNDGPYKIRSALIDLEFEESDIDKYLYSIDQDVWKEKLEKIINKKKSLMKSKSYYMFITKMKNDLYNLGYDKDMIENALSNIEYESDALEKDYNKALRKYSNNKTKLINSLLRKGYSYDEINSLIKKDF
jgi:regulatory protein